ncbi:hypothetical protein TRVA0_080S00342 [Trichomonascus vanleenenianus]|uniref:SMP-30/gluconolactonase/LRE family protein n=1 Tax=Trichomonascus vanleenenianus TaxID=2268995 RepID=UPI003ECBAD8A
MTSGENIQVIDPKDNSVVGSYISRGAEGPFASSDRSVINVDLDEELNVPKKPFVSYGREFLERVTGKRPDYCVVAEYRTPMAHEAAVWLPHRREVLYSSNILDQKSKISVSTINVDTYETKEHFPEPAIANCNGGFAMGSGALLCQQGDGERNGALVYFDVAKGETQVVVDNFYGRPFSAPNDVVIQHDKVWFTDPDYAYYQKLKPLAPQLPNQVYCYDLATRSIRAVADGFSRPNGICFSPDGAYCYITDTGAYLADGLESTEPANIYRFDCDGHWLFNKRLFAFADSGAPDGIKTDHAGNVYAGCRDGINVWNPSGVLIGKFLVNGGVANFCFTDNGVMFALCEERVIKITLHGSIFT